jgi:hypothetical protein
MDESGPGRPDPIRNDTRLEAGEVMPSAAPSYSDAAPPAPPGRSSRGYLLPVLGIAVVVVGLIIWLVVR